MIHFSSLIFRAGWVAILFAASSLWAADGLLRIHMISGSNEYKSEPSLKAFQKHLEEHFNVSITASWGRDGIKSLDGLEHIGDSHLLIVFARRMKLPEDQMALIRKHWESGKPVIGIRTASHAFSRDDNEIFDKQVLGGNYQGHHGGEEVKVTPAEDAASHPILAGVKPFTSRKLYKAGPLPETTTVLQIGDIGKTQHPVTWVNEYRGGRMFYTSLGVPSDFEDEQFRRMLVNAIWWTTKRDEQSSKK